MKLIYRDPSYDRDLNPEGKPVSELQPIGFSWSNGESEYRRLFRERGNVIQLRYSKGFAVVDILSFKIGIAYIINNENKLIKSISAKINREDANFYDVYYEVDLVFVANNRRTDYYARFDEKEMEIYSIDSVLI